MSEKIFIENLEDYNFVFDSEEKENIISKMERLMKNNNLQNADMLTHIETYFLNHGDVEGENTLTMKNLGEIESTILSDKKGKPQIKDLKQKKNSNVLFSEEKSEKISSVSIFNSNQKSNLDKSFITTEEQGHILFTYNEELHNQRINRLKGKFFSKDMRIITNHSKFLDFLNCPVISQAQSLEKQYNYLKAYFEEFLKNTNKTFEKFEDITYLPNKKAFSFVRILCDGDGKLNEKSLLIDYPDLSQKVYLDLTEIDKIILFPNQFIAVEGVYVEEGVENKKLVAERIYTECYEKIDEEIENRIERVKANKINVENNTIIICAAGPYTNKDSITYSPLYELLREIKKIKPDYLFLFGPFIDKNNEIIHSGLLEISGEYLSYDEFFEKLLIDISKEMIDQDTEIFIIPSSDDIINIFPIPQEPFYLNSLKKISKKIKFVSNPSLLEFDGDITFQLFNSNIIDDLRAQSVFKIPISQNRIDPCLNQLIHQKSLAPLYPMSHNIDLRKLHYLRINENPNFIIIPSQIGNGFAKLIEGIVFVNPGFVCKNDSSRSYAQIVIYDDMNIKVENRTRVDIIHL